MKPTTAIAAFAASALVASAHGQVSIPWSTIDGGGGTSTGGPFTLQGTIGQPDTATLSGGSYSLLGGFWSLSTNTPCPADLDDGTGSGTRDGAVTIDDLLHFLMLFEAGNINADLDNDGANPPTPDGGVTIDDLLFFLLRFEQGC